MKKIFAILLVMAMMFAMSTTVLAAENTNLTVSDDRTYNGYKLLNLTTSLKADCGCGVDDEHNEDCYNYAYTINSKYMDILKTQSGETTEQEILDYLATQKSDAQMRAVADSLYKAIVDARIEADAKNLTGTAAIAQGYWLFADVTDLEDENKANSLVIVDTKGQEDLTINPKTSLPTVEKKVLDKNDTSGASDWQDAADHDINDDVSFKLTATLPANVKNYKTYKIAFHDTLSAGLTLKPDTIKVKMYASAADTNGTDVTSSFTRPNAAAATFEVSCNNILAIAGVTKDTVFVVTYDATLNQNAKIGEEGNPNEVYLEFSNNPYGTGTGNTETDKVIVFTYKVVINKVDGENAPLAGAGFTLYKKDSGGNYVAIGAELKGDGMTTFTWTGIDDGDYKLVESTVPAGYNKMDDIEFTVTATHSETSADPELTTLNGGNLATGDVSTGAITKAVVNLTGTVLPETGAKGTFLLITISTLVVMMAAVFMVTRKKMSVYED